MAKSQKPVRSRSQSRSPMLRQRWARMGCGGIMMAALVALVALQFVSDGHEHRHLPAPHGGLLVPIGTDRNHFHAEVVIGPTGVIDLYTLGAEPFPPVAVEPQHVMVRILPEGGEGVPLVLRPAPEAGPPDGPTSRFRGRIPPDLLGRRLFFQVSEIALGEGRFDFTFTSQSSLFEAEYATKVEEELRRFYLTPGGKYTPADITASNRQSPAIRYRGERAGRLMPAQPGERVCPVTRMKPDARFNWMVSSGVGAPAPAPRLQGR